MGKEKYEHCHKMKEYKKKIEDEIDEEFGEIWEKLDNDISRKIRREGVYNWQHPLRTKLL